MPNTQRLTLIRHLAQARCSSPEAFMTLHTSFVRALAVAGVASLVGTSIRAQDTASTANKVPLKQLAPAEARAARGVGAVTSIRALSDGSVYVNDASRRQMLRFDGALKDVRIIADTAPGAPVPYGQRSAGLLPYLGDSSIIVDPSTNAMLVLNAQGKVARIMAAPRNNDINTLASTNLGANAFDTKGQLVYRQGNSFGGPGVGAMFGSGNDRGGGARGGQPQGGQPRAATPPVPGQAAPAAPASPQAGRGGDGGFGGGGFGGGPGGRGGQGAQQPDSVPVVRANFDTRKADSVAWLKVPKSETAMTRGEDGSMRMTVKINPLPQGDDWALLSDGTVAVVRVLDYHVDYFTTDGKVVSSERLPFDWKRISDDDKNKMVDSLKTMAKAITDRSAAQGGNNAFRMNFEVTAAEKLPDYYPPVRAGSSMADRDGNLWILPSTSNLSAQIASQMMGGGGGRGGFGGGPPGGGGGTGGRGAAGDSAARRRAPGDTTGGRGGRDAGAGGFGALAGMIPGMANLPPQVYDVVSRQGELIHRVQVPAGRQLVGFGPNGTVYLAAREGRELFIEKTRLVP